MSYDMTNYRHVLHLMAELPGFMLARDDARMRRWVGRHA